MAAAQRFCGDEYHCLRGVARWRSRWRIGDARKLGRTDIAKDILQRAGHRSGIISLVACAFDEHDQVRNLEKAATPPDPGPYYAQPRRWLDWLSSRAKEFCTGQ